MTYAYLVDCLDREQREAFEQTLRGETEKSKARRERDAVAAAMGFVK